MSPARRQRLVVLAASLYRLILRAYPRTFRERCEAPMIGTFVEVCTGAFDAGIATGLRACASEYASAIAGIWRSRSGRAPARAGREPARARFVQDARFALRRLRRDPTVALLTSLTLGFAIAATAAMFSIVDATLLRPSPFLDADRLMLLSNYSPRTGMSYPGLSREKLKHWRTERELFTAVEAYRRTSVVVTGGVEPEELAAAYVSPGLPITLGLPPREGRLFAHPEGETGAAPVVLLSEAYWRRQLGADPSAVGRTLLINGQSHLIAGIMPARFHFPTRREQLWIPFNPEAPGGESSALTEVLVRLAPGLTAHTVTERVAAAVARLERERPLPTGWGITLAPSSVSGPDAATRRAVLILFGAVALMLLTACANVATLLLSRAVDRQREFAIRAVLGAGRLRVFRELLLEGALLGALATGIGLVAARWALDALAAVAPASIMDGATLIALDTRAFVFTAAVGLLTGVLCNLAPALRAMRSTGNEAITARTRSAADTPVQRRLRSGLVVVEVALAVVLLVGAALMVRSFARLNAIDPGFDPEGLLAVTVGLDTQRYRTEPERLAFIRQVAADVKALPGVEDVAVATAVPPAVGTIGLAQLETESGPCGSDRVRIFANQADPTFLPLMRIELAAGRALRRDDPPATVVLGQSLALQCGGPALVGRKLRLDPRGPWLDVVGIAADVKTNGLLGQDGERVVYLPLESDIGAVLPMTATMIERRVTARRLVIKAARPADLVPHVKRVLWARDPDQPVLGGAPLAELMAESIRRERFMLLLMTLFSSVTLALAAAGIVGMLAYTVAQRRNEIGIRRALGASPGDVLRLVVGRGMTLVAAGTLLGLAGAVSLSRLLAGLLYEVDPRDPVAFAAIPVLVLLLAAVAAWHPARRALRIEPAAALRVE